MVENETLPVGLDTFGGDKDAEIPPPTIGDVGVTDTVSDFIFVPGLPFPPLSVVFSALGDLAFFAAPPKNLLAASNNPIAIILYYRLI
jgi:hypothetical protein